MLNEQTQRRKFAAESGVHQKTQFWANFEHIFFWTKFFCDWGSRPRNLSVTEIHEATCEWASKQPFCYTHPSVSPNFFELLLFPQNNFCRTSSKQVCSSLSQRFILKLDCQKYQEASQNYPIRKGRLRIPKWAKRPLTTVLAMLQLLVFIESQDCIYTYFYVQTLFGKIIFWNLTFPAFRFS